MSIATVNPTTGKKIQAFEPFSDEQIFTKITLAYTTFQSAHQDPSILFKRKKVLSKVAELLEKNPLAYAEIITLEVGKTLTSSLSEVLKSASNCRYYAENGEAFLKPQILSLPNHQTAEIQYHPLGVILAVMPWNFPFWQVLRCSAPILLSGNSILLKHASNVPQCALQIEKLFTEAGLEEGAFQTLLIPSQKVGGVIKDSQVQGVTLTGSTQAGSQVASLAGRHIKKTVLELGGSDPFIVMPSCDLDRAVQTAIQSRLIANGQSCIAAKRFIIHEKIYEPFRKKFIEGFKKIKMGDPQSKETDLGPLATRAIREELHSLVLDATEQGATLSLGGEIPEGPGFFYPPTLLESIPMSAKITQAEAFGPVACFYKVRDTEEAIKMANVTSFGLGASVWTSEDREVGLFSRQIQAGQVFFNALVASNSQLPFGGIKNSGYGRELGQLGAHEFCNIKTIVY